jgi:hypothetical protein
MDQPLRDVQHHVTRTETPCLLAGRLFVGPTTVSPAASRREKVRFCPISCHYVLLLPGRSTIPPRLTQLRTAISPPSGRPEDNAYSG